MTKKNFTVHKTPGGVFVKRFYAIDEKDGTKKVKCYYAKRMNIAEIASYKINEFISGKLKSNNSKYKLATGIAAFALVGVLALGAVQPFDVANNRTQAQSVQINKQNVVEVILKPTPNIYFGSSNQKFLTLDSALEISRYNYANLVEELKNYNSNASEKDKFNFDVEEFDYITFVGVQIRESSFKIWDKDDGAYKGCFKIGSDACIEANAVSLKLTGKKIILSEKDLLDPIKSSKACMYIFVKNYEYLHDNIQKNNKDIKVSAEMVIDTYLMGCGNINKEINGFGYKQKYYSKDVLAYKQILSPYSNKLFNHGLIYIEHSAENKKAFAEINEYVSVRNRSNEK